MLLHGLNIKVFTNLFKSLSFKEKTWRKRTECRHYASTESGWNYSEPCPLDDGKDKCEFELHFVCRQRKTLL